MKLKRIPVWISMVLLFGCSEEPQEKIDHIILAVNNLEEGMKQFEEATGVKPAFGGVHPNSFTQNALVSLGHHAYVEILAPRTDSVAVPDWILQYNNLTPVGWAITSSAIENTRLQVSEAGLAVSEPAAGSRAKPDGSLLSWTSFGVDERRYSVFPFFIQWGQGTVHPSESSPAGCTYVSLKIFSPQSGQITKLTELFRLPAEVQHHETDSMVVQLMTPKGLVSFPRGPGQ